MVIQQILKNNSALGVSSKSEIKKLVNILQLLCKQRSTEQDSLGGFNFMGLFLNSDP